MENVDLYLKVRHAVRIEGLSERATGSSVSGFNPADREQDDEVLGAAGLRARSRRRSRSLIHLFQ